MPSGLKRFQTGGSGYSCTAPVTTVTPGNNRLSGYTYDNAGDLLNDGVNTLTYDAEGRIATSYSPTFGVTTSYIYDAGGQRVSKIFGSYETDYVHDPGGVLLATYVNGSYFGNFQDMWVNGMHFGEVVMAAGNASQTESFSLTNWLGSQAAYTDPATGIPTAAYFSQPFGDAQTTLFGSNYDDIHFTGKERDGESGDDYFGARYYASSMGRFLSPDPITVTSSRQVDPQQLNLYSYVRNNPLTLTDPSGMIISTDDLNDKDKALWAKIVALAMKKNADGSYVNPTLHSAYSALDSDSRTFRIEDDKSLGATNAGQFEITKFNGTNDFSEAKVELNFGVIKDITSTTPGNYDSSFQKYDGLFGKNGFLMRLTETFGHEASHGVFAINDPAQGVNIQRLINDAHGAMNGVKYPVPPDVLQKVIDMNKALEPTERFAQQQEKIINKELQQKQ